MITLNKDFINKLSNDELYKLLENSIININGDIKKYDNIDDFINILPDIIEDHYVGILSLLDNKKIVCETNYNNYDIIRGIIDEDYKSIEDIQNIFEKICNDPSKLMKAINIGCSIPQKISIDESYNENITKKINKFGIGLKNIYDYMVYSII